MKLFLFNQINVIGAEWYCRIRNPKKRKNKGWGGAQ